MRLALFVALLSSTAIVSAQTAEQKPAQRPLPAFVAPENLTVTGIGNLACPVGMRAERQASGQREWIVSLEDSSQPSHMNENRPHTAGVRVVLEGIADRKISQAEVAVYYMAPGVHSLLVNDDHATSASDLKKTFVLSASNAAPSLRLSGNLLVGPAATVSRVRLLSVTYADGSTWLAKSGGDCSVEPGLMMAVAEAGR